MLAINDRLSSLDDGMDVRGDWGEERKLDGKEVALSVNAVFVLLLLNLEVALVAVATMALDRKD